MIIIMCLLKWQQITFPFNVSKWYYCWRLLCYFIDWIILVFIVNNNNTGHNMRQFNDEVYNRKI